MYLRLHFYYLNKSHDAMEKSVEKVPSAYLDPNRGARSSLRTHKKYVSDQITSFSALFLVSSNADSYHDTYDT